MNKKTQKMPNTLFILVVILAVHCSTMFLVNFFEFELFGIYKYQPLRDDSLFFFAKAYFPGKSFINAIIAIPAMIQLFTEIQKKKGEIK